jgi:hypothetical protein
MICQAGIKKSTNTPAGQSRYIARNKKNPARASPNPIDSGFVHLKDTPRWQFCVISDGYLGTCASLARRSRIGVKAVGYTLMTYFSCAPHHNTILNPFLVIHIFENYSFIYDFDNIPIK